MKKQKSKEIIEDHNNFLKKYQQNENILSLYTHNIKETTNSQQKMLDVSLLFQYFLFYFCIYLFLFVVFFLFQNFY